MRLSNFFIFSPDQIAAGIVYKKLADVTLGADAATIDSTAFSAQNVILIELYWPSLDGADIPRIRFNADAGGNYNWRLNEDYAAVTSPGTNTSIPLQTTATNAGGNFQGRASCNTTRIIMHGKAGNSAPHDIPLLGIYTGTSITQVQAVCTGGQKFTAGSRLIVMGY